ncbi:MAG TPA: MT-A70 family methyltransferase [Candidatus Glassbacteria bacterium]|nr:MT-A70 family methyltransferase [Candidatus Glassbacteria bacterium]
MIPFPDKKYNIIYSDPPWTFKTYSEKGKEKKSPELHYNCMNIEDIYNLPVQEISSENCVLFLWVTNPLLKQGLETIERWGFTYKTVGFSWYKKNKIADSFFWGLGYWTRANVELCLLATKGKPTRISKGVHQVINDECYWDTEQIFSVIRKHSQKPDEVRDRIVELCGDLPKIELFARDRRFGWDAWGDQI